MIGRRRGAGTLVIAVAITALVRMASGAAAEELVVVEHDIDDHPEVSLVVAGPSLATATDLPADAFEVTEGGRVVDTAVERLDQRLDVVLAVDTSGSMRDALGAARQAAVSFTDRLRPDAAVAVLGFGATPSVVLPFTADRAAQHQALSTLTASGETAMYDALISAASLFDRSSPGRRVVVLLSDGGDTASTGSLVAARAAVLDAGASLWAVSLTTPESDMTALGALADGTGGRVVAAEDPAALDAAYRVVSGDLLGRYRLTFRSAAAGATDVRVAVAGSSADVRLEYPVASTDVDARSITGPRDGDLRLLLIGAAALFASMTLTLALFLTAKLPIQLSPAGLRGGRGIQEGIAGLTAMASSAAERSLERRGGRRRVERLLEQAGIQLRAGEAMVLLASIAFTGGVLAGLFFGPLLTPVGAAAFAAVSVAAVHLLRSRRRQQFGEQVGDVLQLITGSLRAGYGLLQAIELASRESAAPAGDELRRITTEVRLGRDLADALDSAAERLADPDFAWAVQAIRIHHDVGGDLAAVLDGVAATVRARAHLRREVDALSAEGRLSAVILVLLPIALLGLMTVLNPEYVGELFGSGAGVLLLAAGGSLIVVGALWLRHIVRPVF